MICHGIGTCNTKRAARKWILDKNVWTFLNNSCVKFSTIGLFSLSCFKSDL